MVAITFKHTADVIIFLLSTNSMKRPKQRIPYSFIKLSDFPILSVLVSPKAICSY